DEGLREAVESQVRVRVRAGEDRRAVERDGERRGDLEPVDAEEPPFLHAERVVHDELGEAVYAGVVHSALIPGVNAAPFAARCATTASTSRRAPKRTGSAATRAVSVSAASFAARAAASSRGPVLSAIAATRAGRTGSATRSCS